MNQTKGTIYLRDNAWFRMENVIKMGIASFAKDRSNTYITGEVQRGEYICVIEIPLDKMKTLDKFLKCYFKPYHIYKGGGTEFYNRCIIGLIEPYLQELNIEYKSLTREEINLMNRCERVRNVSNKVKNIFGNLNLKNIIDKYKNNRTNEFINNINNTIKPNEQQEKVLEIIEEFFTSYNTGKIVWACGLGKALLSVFIIKLLKFKTVVFGVPNNNLQNQIKNDILKIFPNKNNILFVGSDGDNHVKSTTDKKQILLFLNNKTNTEPKFVISTYHSCHLLIDNDINFEFKIGDEAHHLVGIEKEENKGFRLFHKIKSLKSLFMTATEKTIKSNTNKEMYSMDDETIFGKYIDVKTVNWAIENRKITDYNILIINNTEDEVDEIINTLGFCVNNKDLFLACYHCLKSFEKYNDLTHLLLYTNTTEDAEIAKKIIDQILTSKLLTIPEENVYNNSLHSKNCNDLENDVCKFKESKYGIISCVYIFGEGFDLPKLNGVCIAGNIQSETRIVQYLLRPNRLELGNPNKKAYIVIPYIDTNGCETDKKSYDKVKTILSQMRNIDENIEHKIIIPLEKNMQKCKETIESINNNTCSIKYSCERCKYYTNIKQHYDNHCNSKKHCNENDSLYIFECNSCKNKYKSATGLRKHKKNCNIKREEPQPMGINETTICNFIEINKEKFLKILINNS